MDLTPDTAIKHLLHRQPVYSTSKLSSILVDLAGRGDGGGNPNYRIGSLLDPIPADAEYNQPDESKPQPLRAAAYEPTTMTYAVGFGDRTVNRLKIWEFNDQNLINVVFPPRDPGRSREFTLAVQIESSSGYYGNSAGAIISRAVDENGKNIALAMEFTSAMPEYISGEVVKAAASIAWPVEYKAWAAERENITDEDIVMFVNDQTGDSYTLMDLYYSNPENALWSTYYAIQRDALTAKPGCVTVFQFNEISEDVFLVTVKAKNVQIIHDETNRWPVGPMYGIDVGPRNSQAAPFEIWEYYENICNLFWYRTGDIGISSDGTMYEALVDFCCQGVSETHMRENAAPQYSPPNDEYWKIVPEITEGNWSTFKFGECGYVMENFQKIPYYANADMSAFAGEDPAEYMPFDGSEYWTKYSIYTPDEEP